MMNAKLEDVNTAAKNDSPWLTAKEAAAYLKMSLNTLRNYVSRRSIPFYKNTMGVLRFKKSELDEWIEKDNQK